MSSSGVYGIDAQSSQNSSVEKYLTFLLDRQYYGIPIGDVKEIVQVQPAIEMPQLPAYAKGIIDLRGQVIPLVDARLRFGKQEIPYTSRTCIIIVEINGVPGGLIVDEVDEVADIDVDKIETPPELTRDGSPKFVTGIAQAQKSMLLLINTKLIFTDVTLEGIEEMIGQQ